MTDEEVEFNPDRLTFARERRGMTKKRLAELLDISARIVTMYESAVRRPGPDTLARMSEVLRFPHSFFHAWDEIDRVSVDDVSFRSLSGLSAGSRNAGLRAADLGVMLADHIAEDFDLPEVDIPDYAGIGAPDKVAESVRHEWGLGDAPIDDCIRLVEARGVRVFALTEDDRHLNAFSFWRDGIPFMFLNTRKSPENQRFDVAHELGHLILHRGQPTRRDEEHEADRFAAAMLMPELALCETWEPYPGLDDLLDGRTEWGVSVAALTVRLHRVDIVGEWHYRQLMIQMSSMGWRKTEPPGGLDERERSTLLSKVLDAYREEGTDLHDLAAALDVDVDELRTLTFAPLVAVRIDRPPTVTEPVRPPLRLVR